MAVRLRQFALSQIELAISYSTDAKINQDEAIHETRRCLKRVRALLRLVRTKLPPNVYERDNLYLRNIGRLLSQLRDAAVVAEMLERLQKEFPAQLSVKDWRQLKAEFTPQKRQTAQVKKKQLAVVARRLGIMRNRVGKWPIAFDDETVLQRALRKSYRSGRRAMKQALKKPSAERFHEWRKQVNHLRHQLRILQDLKIGKVKATLRRFNSLTGTLGQKNDLVVLTHHLQRRPQVGVATARQTLLEFISQRDVAYQVIASKLGRQLYKQKASAFVKKIRL